MSLDVLSVKGFERDVKQAIAALETRAGRIASNCDQGSFALHAFFRVP
jgi:hypothetical protein